MPGNEPLQSQTDPLSSVGRKLLKLDLEKGYADLIVDGPGNSMAKGILENLSTRDLFDAPIARQDEADALLSGLWLRYDWLDESHRISQGIESPTGSWWHAIMHRREGDFSNSKYWYARCENHPILTTLAIQAGDVINPFPADKTVLRIAHGGWNSDAFVDLVESVHDRPSDPKHQLAV